MFKNYIDNYLKDCEYCWNKKYLQTLYKLYGKVNEEINNDDYKVNSFSTAMIKKYREKRYK